ncbi:DUF3379 domain-containing protein [Pseudoalteromonas phenolica]|uniref:DUF3379 domain-containing protein n=1 Tax=Pseudoalteromonas phenolica TaxID=161398 RepID=A0A5S3YRU6_9GAMM|nr:DUF3379 family protein [Pseudoalteromonas phenolica]TMP79758.1 DUF3379 domain-containing protein [Pseudoalteromonas phenolica]
MDELEFRRRAFADPNDPEVIAFAQQNPEQQKLLDELLLLEDKINLALDIPVPTDLTEKLMTQTKNAPVSNVTQDWFGRFNKPFATAASITLAVSLYFLSVGGSNDLQAGEHALAHVYYEVKALERDKEVGLQAVNEKLAMLGAKFESLPGKVTYATFCHFKGQRSLHLIFQSDHGPVTVFVVPHSGDIQDKQLGEFNDARFTGVISNEEKANMILVADRNSPVNDYQEDVKQALRWL